MTGGRKEAFSEAKAVQAVNRIAALFGGLSALEDKLRRCRTDDGDAGLARATIATQLKALAVCSAISREIKGAEALLARSAE